jgi:hypothetical protein
MYWWHFACYTYKADIIATSELYEQKNSFGAFKPFSLTIFGNIRHGQNVLGQKYVSHFLYSLHKTQFPCHKYLTSYAQDVHVIIVCDHAGHTV